MTAFNLNDDNKTRLIKEAWEIMEMSFRESDITRGDGDGENIKNVRKVVATGTAKNVRTPLAKPPAGVESLAEDENEDTGTPDDEVGDEEDADLNNEPELTPWQRLTAAAKELSSAIEAIAVEENGEEVHSDAEGIDEGLKDKLRSIPRRALNGLKGGVAAINTVPNATIAGVSGAISGAIRGEKGHKLAGAVDGGKKAVSKSLHSTADDVKNKFNRFTKDID